jgi:hypothetical protein
MLSCLLFATQPIKVTWADVITIYYNIFRKEFYNALNNSVSIAYQLTIDVINKCLNNSYVCAFKLNKYYFYLLLGK